MTDLCPDCKTQMPRKYGLPALVLTCPKCGQDWIKCFKGLVERSKFHQEKDAWHY